MNSKTIAFAVSATFALAFAAGPTLADPGKADAAKPNAAKADAPASSGGHGKQQFLGSYDGNSDASVSRAEFEAQRKADFTRTNTDSKGDVTEAEYVGEYQARLEKDLAAQRERQLKQAHVRFGVLDANKDGKITQAEYDASGDRIFKKLDTNNDGVIDEKDSAEAY